MRKLQTPKWLQKVETWFHHHHTATYAIAAIFILLVSLLVGAVVFYKSPEETQQSTTQSKQQPAPAAPVKYYSPLTGTEVADQAATTQAATAIMIENSPDARPQSGLKSAGVVFEAVAEGGITRFLALYQQEKPQLIGPVRSLRLYYVDWLAPFQASVAHVGGSKFALDEIRNGSYRDIDQFFNAGTYWRSTDRYAPHNVYTNFQRLDALNTAKGYTQSTVAGFTHKDAAPSQAPTAKSIAVTISGPSYNSSYTYDVTTNSYARSQAGAPHTDREAGQIAPTSVVVMNVAMTKVLEDGYREQITTTGEGKVTIFQDGIVTVGTWRKPNRNSQLSFVDQAGKAIELNRGQTWLTAIPNSGGAVSWQ
ncbi:DUF3048 domain-containing protein [bacterium]|nr:MAG: DUF3048 domain-containing protein [bacterium]